MTFSRNGAEGDGFDDERPVSALTPKPVAAAPNEPEAAGKPDLMSPLQSRASASHQAFIPLQHSRTIHEVVTWLFRPRHAQSGARLYLTITKNHHAHADLRGSGLAVCSVATNATAQNAVPCGRNRGPF